MRALGIDFGTTNSALGIVDDDGAPQLAHFADGRGTTDTFRSILYFEPWSMRGAQVYARLERWHHLSFLKSSPTISPAAKS